MKFIYVDERGDASQGEVFVMCGLMVDAYKLRKKTADVNERLKRLSKQHEGEEFELKTKKFIEGRGGWKSISRLERQNLLSGLIQDALHGGSEVFAIGLSFEAFNNANNSNLGQPFGKDYWVGAAMFISALVQRQNQKLSGNKGNTVFIVDENKQETSKFSDELYSCNSWYDGLYMQQRKIRGKRIWQPRKPADRFDLIINTAFGIKSNNSSLIQVADAMSYVYRRYLELLSKSEKYPGEKKFIEELVSTMDKKRKPIGNVPPNAPCIDFYQQIKHANWKL